MTKKQKIRMWFNTGKRIPLKRQLTRVQRTLIISCVIAFLGIIGVYVLSMYTGIPVSWLTRDPAAVTNSSFCIGILSNLGIMLWSAATTICFLAAFLLSRYNRNHQIICFLISSGILCLILTLDDALMLHEEVIPTYLHIRQGVVYIGYCLLAAGYAMVFWPLLLDTDHLLLLLASLFLGLSVAMDKLLPLTDIETFFEDSLKFTGIVFWLAYFWRAASEMIREGLAQPPRTKTQDQRHQRKAHFLESGDRSLRSIVHSEDSFQQIELGNRL